MTSKNGIGLVCPACKNSEADNFGVVEILYGVAEIFISDEGSWEFNGHTEIDWDSSKSVVGKTGRLQIECGSCHYQFFTGKLKKEKEVVE